MSIQTSTLNCGCVVVQDVTDGFITGITTDGNGTNTIACQIHASIDDPDQLWQTLHAEMQVSSAAQAKQDAIDEAVAQKQQATDMVKLIASADNVVMLKDALNGA